NVIDVNTTPDLFKPSAWRCNSIQDAGQPVGSFGLVTSDGRPSLHLFRGDSAESHGETFCVQGFGTGVGLDLSQYSSVSIRATFKIRSQSLSTCGTQGSECP